MTDPARATPNGDDLPRVAVVVAARDAEEYLAATLESVLAQTYREWECVVVDDGSTDGTAAVAERFVARDARFRLVRQANAGVSAARNAGLDAVSDEVTLLAFVDADDLWLPDTLAVLVAHLTGQVEAAGVYGVAEYVDAAGRPVRPGAHRAVQSDRRRMGRFGLVEVPHDAPSTFASLIVSGTIWPPATALFRRAAVDAAGRFDPSQRYMEDWDLYLRLARRADLVPFDRQVAWYRQHGTNSTGHGENMAYSHARLRWKTWRSEDNSPQQRRLGLRTWRRLQLRWIFWSVGAAASGLRARDHRQVTAALAAVALFTRQLLGGHPVEPDLRTARLIDRFVAPRWAGKGASVD